MYRSKSYQSIIVQIKRLQQEAALLREREKKPVLAAIAEAIHHYQITLPELRQAVGTMAGPRRALSVKALHLREPRPNSHPLTGRKIAPKYRHPRTGDTWTGRGSTPRWLRELESAGTKRDLFLIKRRKR